MPPLSEAPALVLRVVRRRKGEMSSLGEVVDDGREGKREVAALPNNQR
jgi:hypothetical protein